MGEDRQALESERLRTLIEVGRGLVSELDLETLLGRILEVARELTGARYAALGILNEDRSELERFMPLGVDDRVRHEIGHLPRGHGVLGVLITDPRPLRLADVSAHPASYGFPSGHPPMRTFLGVPILIRGEAYGNLYLTEKRGGEFDEADEQALVVLADWAAIAIENARLYGGVEARRQDLELAVRGLEATTAIARAVAGETELERVLELIVKRGRAMVQARSMAILLRDGAELEVAALAGDVDPALAGRRVPAVDVVRPGVAVRREAEVHGRETAERLCRSLGLSGVEALLVPLVFRGEEVGLLAAFERAGERGDFGPEEAGLMLAFAGSAATAVATAKSVAENRLRQSIEAAEQERRRWARELHDETLQGLGALRLLLASAHRRPSAEERAEVVAEAIAGLDLEIENLSSLIAELRPAALDEIGLAAALEGLARQTRLRGLEVHVDADLDYESGRSPERHRSDLDSTVYRIAQEALTNAAKHAGADSATVRVTEAGGVIELTVADDGRGFDPARADRGFGLVGMRERASLAGGTLEVRSNPGGGTAVIATLPVGRGPARAGRPPRPAPPEPGEAPAGAAAAPADELDGAPVRGAAGRRAAR